jgi:signal transduction histidine kinase
MDSRRARLYLAFAVAAAAVTMIVLTYLGAGRAALVFAVVAAVASAAQFGLARLSGTADEHNMHALYSSMKEVSSASDVKGVLTIVARRAADALGASEGVVMIRHGDDLRVFSGFKGDLEPIANAIGARAFATDRELPSVRVLRTAEILTIEDVSDYAGPPGFEDACRYAGIRSVLCVPIMSWNRVAGVLNLGFDEPRHFSASEVSLAEGYAEQAATALERSLAYELELESRRAMQALDDLKSTFVSSVGHELHTPLTTVIGFSEVLSQHWDEFGDADRREFAGRIEKQAKVLSSKVDDLLETRGQGSVIAGPLKAYDLRMLVLGSLGRLLDDLSDRNVIIGVDDNTTVWTQPAAFERIVTHLVSNAIKFSSPGSAIAIASRTVEDKIVLSVRDRGIGIAPEDQDRIFDRFYRVETADSSRGGAGIGLTVSKQLVEKMGGRIWVSSKDGKGSTFSFTMRATAEPEPAGESGDSRHTLGDPPVRDEADLMAELDATAN